MEQAPELKSSWDWFIWNPVLAQDLSYTEVTEMPIMDLLEYHNKTNQIFNLKARKAVEHWDSMDSKTRSPLPPYREI